MSCCDDKPQKGQEKAGLKGLVTGPRRWMLLGAVAVAGGLAMGRLAEAFRSLTKQLQLLRRPSSHSLNSCLGGKA